MADIKHPRHEEALSGGNASKALLLSEAEAQEREAARFGDKEKAGSNRRNT